MRLRLPVVAIRTVGMDVTQRVRKQQLGYKKHYDRRHTVRVPGFSTEDGVHVRNPGHVPKTSLRFTQSQWTISLKYPASY